jgi:hypothetical protein
MCRHLLADDKSAPLQRTAMSGTQPSPTLACYRDAVAERIKAGEAFGDVEDAIDELAD